MLKALFLDMDDTLCDTQVANAGAMTKMGQKLTSLYGEQFDSEGTIQAYLTGIYRQWSEPQRERYMAIIEAEGESAYRVQLIRDLVAAQGQAAPDQATAQSMQDQFDLDRIAGFDFYPGIEAFLAEARKTLTLVVITNGPIFSQHPKVNAVNMKAHVDHILIGGEEPEEKPAPSIFQKALQLAECEAHEAVHFGDSLVTDIGGANATSIPSVWIQHDQVLDLNLGGEPKYTLTHPREIPSLVTQLSQL
ncbi:MAG: N-acylneuraminate-9-phosphatase [Alteromonadaceae bacterium]|nr:MAG: N-acylneuraminate-9-phosphatase [Alteromonadaceae bacterium]